MKLCHINSATTQFTSYAQHVHHRQKCMLAFSDVFPKQLGIFSANFTCLLYVHIYTRKQIVIQLSPTVTKLCHIKCDHPACVSADGGHFEHMMVVALGITSSKLQVIEYNFVVQRRRQRIGPNRRV